MSIWDDDAFHNVLSFALFTICALLVGVLVWVLLRRLRRQREMRDQETMTVEPSVKQASIADSVSGTGASRKESTLQIPGVEAHETTKSHQRSSVGEGPQLADSQAPTTTAAPDTTKSPPPGGSEQITEAKAEAKAEAKEQSSALGAASPGDSRQTSVLTSKSKRHHHSHSKKSPESGKAEKEDGKGRKSSAASKTGSKVGSKAGSKPPSRRSSVQHSQASAGKASAVDGKGASSKLSASMPAVPALLIRRPSTDSKSSQRSNRSTRYVRETPKVPPPLDIFSREHSSMAESPPSNPIQSPPQAGVATTEPAKPPEAPQASSTTEALEKLPAEATTEGH